MGATRPQLWLFALAGCGRVGFDNVDLTDASPPCVPDEPSLCPIAGVGLCDGFEQPSLDPSWLTQARAGSVTVDTTRAYRGCSSLHFHTDPVATPTEPNALARNSRGSDMMVVGNVYVRAFVYVQSPHPSNFDQILNFADINGDGISTGINSGFVHTNDYTFFQSATSTLPFPLDQWVCYEMRMPSAEEGTTEVWVSGNHLTDITLTTPAGMPQPPPDHIYIGIDFQSNASGLPALDVWIDEIMVDELPPDCEM